MEWIRFQSILSLSRTNLKFNFVKTGYCYWFHNKGISISFDRIGFFPSSEKEPLCLHVFKNTNKPFLSLSQPTQQPTKIQQREIFENTILKLLVFCEGVSKLLFFGVQIWTFFCDPPLGLMIHFWTCVFVFARLCVRNQKNRLHRSSIIYHQSDTILDPTQHKIQNVVGRGYWPRQQQHNPANELWCADT